MTSSLFEGTFCLYMPVPPPPQHTHTQGRRDAFFPGVHLLSGKAPSLYVARKLLLNGCSQITFCKVCSLLFLIRNGRGVLYMVCFAPTTDDLIWYFALVTPKYKDKL